MRKKNLVIALFERCFNYLHLPYALAMKKWGVGRVTFFLNQCTVINFVVSRRLI